MKNFVRILCLALVCILAMSLIACGSEPAESTTPEESAETDAAQEPTNPTDASEPAGPADDFDWSAYPADFNEWTSENMKTYLLAREVLGNEDFMFSVVHSLRSAG